MLISKINPCVRPWRCYSVYMNSNTKPNGTTKLPYKVIEIWQGERIASEHRTEKAAKLAMAKYVKTYARIGSQMNPPRHPAFEIEVIV